MRYLAAFALANKRLSSCSISALSVVNASMSSGVYDSDSIKRSAL